MAWAVIDLAVLIGVLTVVWWGTWGSRYQIAGSRARRLHTVALTLLIGWITTGALQALVLRQRRLGVFAMVEGLLAILLMEWLIRRQSRRARH